VAEPDRCGHLKVGAVLGGQGGRHFQAQPTLIIDADGFVATVLPGFPVGGHKQAGGVPALPPLGLVDPGGRQVEAVAPQPFPAHRDRRMPGAEVLLRGDQAMAQAGQPAGLGEPLPSGGVAALRPAPPATVGGVLGGCFTGTQRTPLLEDLDRGLQIPDMGAQRPHPQLVLVLDRPGQRPRPS
jgi:hypothetical protein